MLIAIDGPEKAGKTTLARRIIETYGGHYRHFGPTTLEEMSKQLSEDIRLSAAGECVVWDRSHLSACVYDILLARKPVDVWLYEWLLGRAFDVKIVLLDSPEQLAARRTADDLPLDPAHEASLFASLGAAFGWHVLGGRSIDIENLLLPKLDVRINHAADSAAPEPRFVIIGVPPSPLGLPPDSPTVRRYSRLLGLQAVRNVVWSTFAAGGDRLTAIPVTGGYTISLPLAGSGAKAAWRKFKTLLGGTP